MPLINQWPDGHSGSFRIINSYPKELLNRRTIKILVSRFFPIGDFDFGRFPQIDEPARIYKTERGWRIFYINRVTDNIEEMCRIMKRHGADVSYLSLIKNTGTYAARIDPKKDKIPGSWCVAKLITDTGKRLDDWNELINEHDKLTNAYNLEGILV